MAYGLSNMAPLTKLSIAHLLDGRPYDNLMTADPFHFMVEKRIHMYAHIHAHTLNNK